jgi:spore coat polysaccharide biosynthesis predicted glycosyltransferase SpsG
MNRDPILMRVDATPDKGHERLARCQIFAMALQRRRRPTYFVSQLEPRTLAQSVKRGGNNWLEADYPAGSPDDLRDLIQEVHRLNPAAVIVDDADVSQDYLVELASTGVTVLSFDHHGMIHLPSQLVVNPLLGPGREGYEFDPGTQLLLGRRYALVRPEIRRNRPNRSQEPAPLAPPEGKTGQLFRVLVALGEDDPHRHTLEFAKMILNMPKVGMVDIIVRREHPDLAKIQAVVEANKERMELALEPSEIAAKVVRCHFALTGGSGWSLELACLGVPQLLIVQNESHWPNAQRLEEEGCANCLGWHESVTPQTIRLAVQNMLSDPLERQAMARCSRKLIDGRGPDRLVTALEVMLHPRPIADFLQDAA